MDFDFLCFPRADARLPRLIGVRYLMLFFVSLGTYRACESGIEYLKYVSLSRRPRH